MTTSIGLAGSPGRPFLLFFIGVVSGLAETFASPSGLFGTGGLLQPRAFYVVALGIGLALEAGVPKGRLARVIGFSLAGALGDALFSPVSAALGRACLGAGIGAAVSGPGPLFARPALGAFKGGLGACIAGPLVLLLHQRGAPVFLLPGMDALVIGLLLSQGRAERLLAVLSVELDAIKSRGTQEMRSRADRIVALAVEAVNETDAHEERTGEDLSAGRAEIAATARHALGLLRRLAAAPDAALVGVVADRLEESERMLEVIYRRELGFVLARQEKV